MPQAPTTDQALKDAFLAQCFENDAKGILQDLLGNPALAMHFFGFSEEDTWKAIRHVQGILEECYRTGHLKVAMSHEGSCLYGYALIFEHPDPSFPRYCHKIFVYEKYRGHGIGTQLLQALPHDSRGTCLICREELVPFYEKAGFELKGEFTPPGEQHGFGLTHCMYTGLMVMGSPSTGTDAPVFMLNDQDIKQLMALG